VSGREWGVCVCGTYVWAGERAREIARACQREREHVREQKRGARARASERAERRSETAASCSTCAALIFAISLLLGVSLIPHQNPSKLSPATLLARSHEQAAEPYGAYCACTAKMRNSQNNYRYLCIPQPRLIVYKFEWLNYLCFIGTTVWFKHSIMNVTPSVWLPEREHKSGERSSWGRKPPRRDLGALQSPGCHNNKNKATHTQSLPYHFFTELHTNPTLGDIFKGQTSKLERLICHVSVKTHVRVFEVWHLKQQNVTPSGIRCTFYIVICANPDVIGALVVWWQNKNKTKIVRFPPNTSNY